MSASSPSPKPKAPPPVVEELPGTVLRSLAALPSTHKEPDDLTGELVSFGNGGSVVSFNFERKLEEGGMGEVYLATQLGAAGFSRRVAIKVTRRASLGNREKPLIDEARLHGKLHHRNIVQAHGLFEKAGTYYLVMEYLEGNNLRQVLMLAAQKGRRLSEATVCHLIAEVADGLDYVHQAMDEKGRPLNIVHRDVSPHNIRVTTAGEVKLLDFGVALSALEDREETNSSIGFYKGKVNYLSPEQASRKPVDGRTDIFALTCVLGECLVGQKLFQGVELALGDIRAVTPEDVERRLQGVPRELLTICQKGLAREPSQRFATAREFAEAVRAYAQRHGYHADAAKLAKEIRALKALPDAPSPPRLGSPPESVHRRWMAVATIAAVILTGILVAFQALHTGEPTAAPAPQETIPMPRPPPTEPPSSKESPPESAVTSAPMRPPRAKGRTSATSSCLALLQAAAMTAALTSCRAHVSTGTKTGDCSVRPVREVKGHKLPEVVSVEIVSLNGKGCTGPARGAAGFPNEPCPAGEGTFIMMPRGGNGVDPGAPDFLDFRRTDEKKPLLYGQAHLVRTSEMIHEYGKEPRQGAGRMHAIFTELRMEDGTPVPVCGVLFSKEDERTVREGIPVLDPKYYGDIATPLTATAFVKFYWPQ